MAALYELSFACPLPQASLGQPYLELLLPLEMFI